MTPVFLIIDADPYVGGDLSEIIRETIDDAQVIHTVGIDEHTLLVVDTMDVSGVFLGGLAETAAAQDLISQLAQRGVALARIGRTGERSVASAGPGIYIRAPFTAATIAEVLRAWTKE